MENNNKIYCKPTTYRCGICGAEYHTVAERMKCEQACLRKQEEEAKKAAEAKKNAEKDVRFAEASTALDNALDLVGKCVEDFGAFKYSGKLKESDMFNSYHVPSKLWHHFFF